MATTLKLRRWAGLGIELRRGRFDVLIDGRRVDSIDHGDTVESAIEPGHHTLQIRSGRYSSRSQGFDAADGEVVKFRCHGIRIWPLYLASILKPNIAITLRRE